MQQKLRRAGVLYGVGTALIVYLALVGLLHPVLLTLFAISSGWVVGYCFYRDNLRRYQQAGGAAEASISAVSSPAVPVPVEVPSKTV